ncbi:alpha/beta fold hydrolase [Halohasta litorea]|uniref:Alpha/beta fold hydrolase n=1 Tax=Halohasta litorea TaxID=869891 RepID=A0ABD6DAR3_9EURY|nr:alpha/beta hydrolase [Halohasta litorea]
MGSTLDATVLPESVGAESVFIDTNGVRLHTVQAGPEDGPLVVLLHGFPECWYGWHRQLGPLAKAGYRVVIPDQRGYNLSDKPAGVASYRLDELAADIVGLIDACGREQAIVAGHDWGAAVAWWLGLEYPDRLSRLCIVNVPHPTVFEETLREGWSQRLKSAYFLWFQLSILPELTTQLGDWWIARRALESTSRPGTFSRTDLERYQLAWSRPGAATGMINWYRAAVRHRRQPVDPRVSVPTLVLWGARDQFLQPSMARDSRNYCEEGELRLVEEASHWILHEESAVVVEALLEFLPEPPVAPSTHG